MKKILFFMVFLLTNSFFTMKKLTWVAIGDSITYLNDHPGETNNRVMKGFLTRVTEQLPNIYYINKGYNGWRTTGIAKEIGNITDDLQIETEIYTVFLGTNDWWGGEKVGTLKDYQDSTGVGTFNGAYRTIIERLKKLNPKAKVILITPMQRGDFVYIYDHLNNAHGSYREKDGQTLEQFANAVIAICKYENFEVVDLYHKSALDQKNLVKFKVLKNEKKDGYKYYPYPEHVGVPFDPKKDSYPYPFESMDMTYDGLHPSDKGNAVIADMLVNVMKKFSL
jgi:lysophospholipase L1-like esterase